MATTTSSPKSPPQTTTTTAGFHLTKGTEVEVSTEDKGFRGVWNTATVIEPPPKSNNLKKRKKALALVEFKRLLADDGSTPLTEYADPDFIRPAPPVQEEGCVFAVNDVVDARYRDGWWMGSVEKVLEGPKYRVYFDNLPDVIDFSGDDLRFHLKWSKGSWSRIHRQHRFLQAPESKFSTGTEVEVIDKERFQDIWFPAIVVRENNANSNFMVKFRSLRADDVAIEEKVIIDSQCIRPVPAHDVDRKFELLEKVDAVYDGGWRAGVITKVLTGGRYNVFFKQGNEDRELSHSDVRPHLDWTGDNWVCKSKEVTIASGNQDHSRSSKYAGNHVINGQLKSSAIKTDNTEDQTPCIVKLRKKWTRKQTPSSEEPILLAVVSPTKKRVKMTASCCNAASPCPLKKSSEENTVVPPLSSQNGTARKTTRERSTNESFSRLDTPKRQVANRYTTKSPIGDQSSAPIKSPLVRAKRIKQVKPGQKNQIVYVVKSKRKPRKAKVDIADISAAVKEGTADVPAADNMDDDDVQKVEVARTSYILGLVARKRKNSEVASPQHGGVKSPELMKDLKQKENLDDSTKDKSQQIKLPKEVKSSQRRKRGRPRKWPLAAEAGMESSGADADSVNIATDPLVVDPTASTKTDSPDPKTTEAGTAAAAENSNVMVDDDQPLSTWIGVNSSTNNEESRKQAVNGTSESKDTHVDVKKSSVQGKNAEIPFIKQSPVWGTIESMEVFQIAPQEPHFSHLAEVKEEYREGSAIGMMVTFAALFEKISKLKIDDPKSIFDSTLESLVDLEKHGFDVTVLEDRLRKLLAIKVEKEQLQNEFSDSDRTMIKHSCEKAKFEVEMRELKKKITELQELLETTRSKKEAEDQEVTLWKSEIKNMHERIQHAQNNFANAASAPWKST